MLKMTRTQEVWMTIRTDSNAEMTRTIEKMEESDIRAIVSIFQFAFVHEYSLVKKRQLDYSVENPLLSELSMDTTGSIG